MAETTNPMSPYRQQTVTFVSQATPFPWSLMPATKQELLNTNLHRLKLDLSYAREAMLQTNVATAGLAGSSLRCEWSSNQAVWAGLDGGTGPAVAIDDAGFIDSGWIVVTPVARGVVFVRVVGIDGNGIVSPSFGAVAITFR